MIKHIILWRLHDYANGAGKSENAKELRARLLALPDEIGEIKKLEVGININTTDAASDVVLYAEFETPEDLSAYQHHPAHQKIIQLLNKIRSEKRVVDYMA